MPPRMNIPVYNDDPVSQISILPNLHQSSSDACVRASISHKRFGISGKPMNTCKTPDAIFPYVYL